MCYASIIFTLCTQSDEMTHKNSGRMSREYAAFFIVSHFRNSTSFDTHNLITERLLINNNFNFHALRWY